MSADIENPSADQPTPADIVLNNAEILNRIFSFLDLSDRRSVELTSKFWRSISMDTPLKLSILDVTCERSIPPKLYVSFCGFRWFIPFVPHQSDSLTMANDPSINSLVRSFFGRLLSTYGESVTAFNFGGDDVEHLNPLDAAFTDPSMAIVYPQILWAIRHYCVKNLTSISLRSVALTSEAWPELVELIGELESWGRLEQLCLHGINTFGKVRRRDDFELTIRLTRNMLQLKRCVLSAMPKRFITEIVQCSAYLEDEGGEEAVRREFGELFLSSHQSCLVNFGIPDSDYLSILQMAEKLNLELQLRDFYEIGIDAAFAEIMRLSGRRLKSLDLRMWWNDRNYASPIASILPDFEPILDSIQQLSLYGNDAMFDNDSFSAFVGYFSVAPNLRRLSLGKVCGLRVTDFRPLANVAQLDELYLSALPKLGGPDLSCIVKRMVNLKKLWLRELPSIKCQDVLDVLPHLEALEISKCESFHRKTFFEQLYKRRFDQRSTRSDRLEFVKVKGFDGWALKYLKWATRLFERCGIRVIVDQRRRQVTLIVKNYPKWRDVESIRLPWFNCAYCGGEINPNY